MSQPTLKVVYHFEDKERNKGTVTLYCALSLSDTAKVTFINTMAGYMAPLSNAVITEVRTYYKIPYDGIEASSDSDVTTRVLLYYSEGEVYETIDIPSPKEEIWETEGEYIGIRVDPFAMEMVTWFDNWFDFQSHITTAEGEAFPAVYLVGGKAE